MSARDLIERAQATGVKILADHGELILRGDAAAVDALIPEAKEHKAELLAMLPDTELDRLIDAVAAVHGFTLEQAQEAREIAAGDTANALTCFRALAAKAGIEP